MDASRPSLSPGTQEVLNDLLAQRGLTEWQLVLDVRSSPGSDESVDIIYGYALTASLQEERVDRKRKQKAGKAASGQEPPTRSCFVVLSAVSSSHAAPTLSMKRILALQQCADTNEPSGSIASPKPTFLCLTDGANISYYAVHAPAILP